MRRYQIIKKPVRLNQYNINEPKTWSFVAHGAVYVDSEGVDIERILADNGYSTRRLTV